VALHSCHPGEQATGGDRVSWTMGAIIVIGLWVAVWICVGYFFDDEDPPESGSLESEIR